LVHAGRMAEGQTVLGWSSARQVVTRPSLLRLKGELALLQGTLAAAETAKDFVRQVLDEAHRQGALSWELRAAASVARLLRKQGHSDDAVAVLQPIYDRFTEGFGAAYIISSKHPLAELGVTEHL
jgi:hypothetical protein